MHLFIPNTVLTAGEVEVGRTHNALAFSLGDTTGHLFDEANAVAYLREIDAVIVNRHDTGYDSVQKLEIRFPRQPDRVPTEVLAGHWCIDLPFQRIAEIVREILLPVVGMHIRVDLMHGVASGPFEDNCFHISVYSSPENDSTVQVPREMWGIERTGTKYGYPPTGRGSIITAPDAPDYAVAEIVGDVLYVHHDALRRGSNQELKIFRHILEETAILLGATEEEREARRKALRKIEQERAREAYVEVCRGRIHEQVRAAEKTLEESPQRIDAARQKLTAAIREQATARIELERLRGTTEDMDGEYRTEFDKLTAHPQVVDVRMKNGKLMVYTDTIFCMDDRTGKRHEIGSFRIEFNVDDRDINEGTVRWFNLDRQVDGYDNKMQAPHVWKSGQACLGNAYETFAELFSSYEYALAVDYAIQFVESANTNDHAGRHIDKWPLAAEQPQQAQTTVAVA